MIITLTTIKTTNCDRYNPTHTFVKYYNLQHGIDLYLLKNIDI